jgi:antitoxin component YwqK of YwqJK toxin-antitoxin module
MFSCANCFVLTYFAPNSLTMTNKIKSVELYRTNIIITDPDEEGEIMDETIINRSVYDENGNETERITYSSTGENEERIIIRYADGKPVEEILELDGEVAEKTTREFDEKGVLLREFRHYQDGEPDEISYSYENGRLVQKLVTDSDGEEGEKYLWHYKDGKLEKEESFDEYGRLDLSRKHSYTDSGSLEETVETRISDDDKIRIVTLFDEAGNLVQERRYDTKGNLVARSTSIIGENKLPTQTEEETVMGKTISIFTYDGKGNNIKLEEKTGDDEAIGSISRQYNEAGQIVSTEVHMEPTLNRPGQHYSLTYKYEFFS